ncbi:MAG: hypothetical protein ACKO96_35855 [Flammeovirgaceae bacterium]
MKIWPRSIIDGMLPFLKPQFINAKQLIAHIEKTQSLSDIYCGFFFINSGKQVSVFRDPRHEG